MDFSFLHIFWCFLVSSPEKSMKLRMLSAGWSHLSKFIHLITDCDMHLAVNLTQSRNQEVFEKKIYLDEARLFAVKQNIVNLSKIMN